VLVFFGILTVWSSYYIIVEMDLEDRPGCKTTDFFVGLSAFFFTLKVIHGLNLLFDFGWFNDYVD